MWLIVSRSFLISHSAPLKLILKKLFYMYLCSFSLYLFQLWPTWKCLEIVHTQTTTTSFAILCILITFYKLSGSNMTILLLCSQDLSITNEKSKVSFWTCEPFPLMLSSVFYHSYDPSCVVSTIRRLLWMLFTHCLLHYRPKEVVPRVFDQLVALLHHLRLPVFLQALQLCKFYILMSLALCEMEYVL